MSDAKKGALFVTLLGFAFIILGILTLVICMRMPHYTATITEITDTFTSRSRKSRIRKYNERVTVEYIDGKGNEKTASGIRVKRNIESSLPKVGDTIQVKEFLGVGEYSQSGAITIFISFIFLGILMFISGKTRSKYLTAFLYCIIYGTARFILEFFRYDSIRGSLGGLSTSQWISLGLITGALIGGAVYTIYKKNGNKKVSA